MRAAGGLWTNTVAAKSRAVPSGRIRRMMLHRLAGHDQWIQRFHQRFGGTRRAHRYTAAGWLLLYELLAVGMFRRVIIDHVLTFQAGGDASQQGYAWLMKVWQAARHGRLVLWDFGVYAGTSFLGGMEPAPFYPLAILFSPLVRDHDPFWVDLFIVLHFGLGAWFMHLFLRRERLSIPASIIGAVLFVFVGSVAERPSGQPYIFFGLIFIPAVLGAVLAALRSPGRRQQLRWSMLAGIALAMMPLAGHVHGLIHTGIGTVILVAIFVWRSRDISVRRAALTVTVLMVTAGLVAAVQLVPTHELLRLAYAFQGDRLSHYPHIVPAEALREYSLTWKRLASVFEAQRAPLPPDGGTLFLTFTGFGLAVISLRRLRDPIVRFGWIAALVMILAAAGGQSWTAWLYHRIPVLNMVREPARALHFYAFAVAVLAAVGLDVVRDVVARRPTMRLALSVGCGALVLFETAGFVPQVVGDPRWPEAVAQAFDRSPVAREIARVTALDGYLYRYRIDPSQRIAPNLPDVLPVFGVNGRRATVLRSLLDFASRDRGVDTPTMDLLSVRYLVTQQAVPGLIEIGRVDGLHLYERPTALPMFWRLSVDGIRHREPLGMVRWDVNSVRLDLTGDLRFGDSVVFSQPAYPGWRVYIDGRERKLERYEIFNRVRVTPGDRRIEFVYLPGWLLLLGLVSVGTVAGCAWLIVTEFSASPPSKPGPSGLEILTSSSRLKQT